MTKIIKLVTYVPLIEAAKVREAIGNAGAGELGHYTHCTFSSRGLGRFKPGPEANPAIGSKGKMEEVEEERIETWCEYEKLKDVIKAIKAVHPYEEVPIDIYPIENIE